MSAEKSKRAVIITEIYGSPLKVQKNRGKHGTYVDDMRRLLLRRQEYSGKHYVLWNELGLFSRYFEKVTASNEIQKLIKSRTNSFDYNLWHSDRKMLPSEREYRILVSNQLKRITESALNSLQKDGIIEWKKHYLWIPNIFTLTDDCKPRIKSFLELQEDSRICGKALCKAASKENSVLNPDMISALFIGAQEENQPLYEALKSQIEIDKALLPIPTTNEQTIAIENYQSYIRQCAYAKYLDFKKLPKKKSIPNKGEIFRIPELKNIYQGLDKSFNKRLLGDITFWQEIKYHVIDEQKLERYFLWDESAFDTQLAEQVSLNVLKHMDRKMKENKFKVTKEGVDEPCIGGFGKATEGTMVKLGKYEASNKLHQELRQLYPDAGMINQSRDSA